MTTETVTSGATTADGEPFRFFDNREKYLLFVTTTSEKAVVAARGSAPSSTTSSRRLRRCACSTPARATGRARQRAARSPPPDADRAVRGGRQGSQHGGHAADAVDAARSLLGAPRDRGRAHQHVLRRGARSCFPATPPRRAGSTGGRSVSTARPRTSSSSRSVNSRTCSPRDGRRSRARRPATRVRQAVGARALPQGPRLRPRRPDPAQHRCARRTSSTTSCSPPSRTARAPPAESKVKTVLAPIARALAPDGRLVVVQSTGHDPGMEIVRRIWPDGRAVRDTPRHMLIKELDRQLNGRRGRHAATRSSTPTTPRRCSATTCTPCRTRSPTGSRRRPRSAAWNAAVYVAQIDDERVAAAMQEGDYLQDHQRRRAQARRPVVPGRELRRRQELTVDHESAVTGSA